MIPYECNRSADLRKFENAFTGCFAQTLAMGHTQFDVPEKVSQMHFGT